ncbi:MAG: hypothetical protein RL020_1319 [Pseudomonadota bacterium]
MLTSLHTPSLLRRLACMLYDALLLIAMLFIAAFAFSTLLSFKGTGPLAPLFQIYMLSVITAYYFYFWRNGGQTLAMKTWRIKLISANGAALSYRQCAIRLLIAGLSLPLFFWALFDRDGQFLHDRIAKTRLVLLEKN